MADKAKLQALFRARAEQRESARPTPSVAELRAARAAKAGGAAPPHAQSTAAVVPVPQAATAAVAMPPPPARASHPQPPQPRAPAPPPAVPAARSGPVAPPPAPLDATDEPLAKRAHVGGALPAGFFDNKEADMKARGVALPTKDPAAALKEFQESIVADVAQVEERELAEQEEEADEKHDAELHEQQLCLARVEELKQQAAQRRQAALLQRQAGQQPPAAATAPGGGSSDSDSDAPPDDLFDWRAKRVK